jgi:NADH-quinone oxidoreductase subunit N
MLIVFSVIYNAKLILSLLNARFLILNCLLMLLLLNNNPSDFFIFDYLLVQDQFNIFIQNILILNFIFCIFMSYDYIHFEKITQYEYFLLLGLSLLGVLTIVQSNDLITLYLAIELQSLAFYVLASFKVYSNFSTEAGLKYFVLGAFSSGILLFGISLIYGTTGTISFSAIPQQLDSSSVQIMAFVFLFSAFAFKLSIVPFHLWTADVYEGSPIVTTSFLSVISKGAVAFIFITVLYKVFQPMQEVWYSMLVILAVATMVIGNLFALRQQNIKRFLAFSSIAQVGFILVGISSGGDTNLGITAVVYFILIYVFSNLAAFGVATVISEHSGKENIDDYKGLYKTNPFLSWMLALALFSLAGVPPTAGFFGKLFLLTAGASKASYWFITIAALNMIVSLYYYLKVVRAMFMDKNEQPIEKIKINPSVKMALILCGAGIVLTGLLSWIYEYIQSLS